MFFGKNVNKGKMKCNQCSSDKPEQDFWSKDRVTKTCRTCRDKWTRNYHKNTDAHQQVTKLWKIENKEYVQQMNEFYRTTTTLTKEDRALLKDAIKMKTVSHHYLNQEGTHGKDCAIPQCGWQPLALFESSEFAPDKLASVCKRCGLLRKKIRDSIVQNVYTQLKFLLKNPSEQEYTSIQPYIGCSISFYKRHIESLFTEDMTWDKLGYFYITDGEQKFGIHIDHKIPINAFDLTNPRELFLCFHWKNCQPLWGHENMKKKK